MTTWLHVLKYVLVCALLCGGLVLVWALVALAQLRRFGPPRKAHYETPRLARLEKPGAVAERIHGKRSGAA